MMKKQVFFLLLSGAFALLHFASCTDTDYDLDKLNKEAVFSQDGISAPIGTLDTILFKKLLDDLAIENLSWDESGLAYIRESGTFDVDLPDISDMELNPAPYFSDWESFEIEGVEGIEGVEIPETGITVPINPGADFMPIMAEGEFSFNFDADLGNDWDIDVDSVSLKNCAVDISIMLRGMTIYDEGSDTEISIELGLSEHFVTSDNLTIKKALRDITNYTISERIKLSQYNFNESEVAKMMCRITFKAGDQTSVKIQEPQYQLSIQASDIDPSTAYGKISCSQTIAGDINLSSLKDALDDSDVLKFDRPVLKLTATTNLGMDFNLENIELTADENKSVDNPSLSFKKPAFSEQGNNTSETTYWLAADESHAPEKTAGEKFAEFDITPLFANVPDKIGYSLDLTSGDQNAYLKWGQTLELDAAYELKAPLSFSQLSISLKDTLMDVFTDELRKRVFNTGTGNGDVEIVSDVDIFLKNVQSQSELKIEVKAVVVNEDGSVNNKATIVIEPSEGLKNGTDQRLSIKITKESMQYLSQARHLALAFVLKGSNVAFTSSDYILLKNLKVKKEGGIYFEL